MSTRRPTKYTPKLGQLICNKIASTTQGLVKLCINEGLPEHTTILRWLGEPDKTDFLQNYRRAREAQADLLDDEIIEIADKAEAEESATQVARARLRIDARKWKAAKILSAKNDDNNPDKMQGNEGKGNTIEWDGVIMSF